MTVSQPLKRNVYPWLSWLRKFVLKYSCGKQYRDATKGNNPFIKVRQCVKCLHFFFNPFKIRESFCFFSEARTVIEGRV